MRSLTGIAAALVSATAGLAAATMATSLLTVADGVPPSASAGRAADVGNQTGPDRITIVTDAFGSGELVRDWGYAALVEIGGRRMLFDAGNDAARFEQNVRALDIDLGQLDFVVVSHRHGDHTAGLRAVRRANPAAKIYTPRDEHFGGPTPPAFFKSEPSLPPEMRYFGGRPPALVPHGSAWGDITFTQIESGFEIFPGVRLLALVSEAPGMRDLGELSLAIDTPSGLVIVVGCSHPGVERIVERAAANREPVRLLAGGFHWVSTPIPEVQRMAAALRDTWKVAAVAPGHCTGEPAFKALQEYFGEGYVYAGVGTVIPLQDR